MAEYNIGDNVILKDDGQIYKVVGARTEDRRASHRLTVLRSQLEIKKVYRPQQPQIVIYNKM